MPLKLVSDTKENPLQKIKHIIGVAAGKGGVGKSTVTVYLARALKKLNYKVGVLDADIYGPSLRKMFSEGNLPSAQNEKHYPAMSEEIEVMSMGYFRQEHEASAVRSPVACSILMQFIKDIVWGDLDFLIIDFPPGTGDIQLTLSQQISLSGVVMVTTPQEIALMDVKKACHLFQQVKIPLLGVIENMSFYRDPTTKDKKFLFGQGGGLKLSAMMNIPLFGEIPLDPQLSISGDEGSSILDSNPESETSQVFLSLARQIAETLSTQEEIPSVIFNDHHLALTWPDGKHKKINISELQGKCSCQGCFSAKKEKGEDVKIVGFTQVGRYALRFKFSSGCSKGIYHFDLLREFI